MIVIDEFLATMDKSKRVNLSLYLQKYTEVKEAIKSRSGEFEDEKERMRFQSPCNSLINQINRLLKEA